MKEGGTEGKGGQASGGASQVASRASTDPTLKPVTEARPAPRSAESIDADFSKTVVNRRNFEKTVDRFERLWDESNRAAIAAMGTPGVEAYLTLLWRMQRWYKRNRRTSSRFF